MQTNGKKVLALVDCEAVYTDCEYLLRYVTGFAAEDGCVIIDKKGMTLYTDRRYIEAAEKTFAGTDVTPSLDGKKEILQHPHRLHRHQAFSNTCFQARKVSNHHYKA